MDGIATVDVGDFQVSSNAETAESMQENLADPKPEGEKEPDASSAASVLGKRGGEASAARRAEAKKEAEKAADSEGTGKDGAEAEKPAAKPRSDPEARVRQATAQLAEERRQRQAEREAMARELAELRAARAPEKPEAQPKDPNARPQEGDFENYGDYVEAVAEWKAEQKLQKVTREAQERQRQAAIEQQAVGTVEAYRGRISEAVKADPEWWNKVDHRLTELVPSEMLPDNAPWTVANGFADELMLSEHSPALLLHFSGQEAEVVRILENANKQPDIPSARRYIAREIAVVESRLSQPAPAKPEPPAVSKAKPPITPVSASAQEPDNIDDIEDFDAWKAKADARDRQAGRRR